MCRFDRPNQPLNCGSTQSIDVRNGSGRSLERVNECVVKEFHDLMQSLQNQPLQFCDRNGKCSYVSSIPDFEQLVSKRDGWSLMLPDPPFDDEECVLAAALFDV